MINHLIFYFTAPCKPLSFSPVHDYRSEDYLRDTDDGSATLGFGFYTTDNKDEASNYSFVRQGRNVQAHLIVTPILPYQARVLGTAHSPRTRNSVYMPSPPWAYLFSDFMREEGYDGLVYNEGGEGHQAKGGTSYVFYNLDTIGTYESWRERDT